MAFSHRYNDIRGEVHRMIQAKDLLFSYEYPGSPRRALDGVSMQIDAGELVVLLGCNGSGKSTLLRHFNGLLPLQSGQLRVAGLDASKPEHVWELRRKAAMVFQNPDNQFVSSVVAEDVAFGLENYQVPREQIPGRVRAALELVGMGGFASRAPHTLSGGQKQRVALAGVLALEPDILLLDEVTSMLDPQGREEVLAVIQNLHRAGKTIVMVTHDVEEALLADRVYLLHKGKIRASGTPRQVLTNGALLREVGILPPLSVRLFEDFAERGIRLPGCPLGQKEAVASLWRYLSNQSQ